MCLVRYFPAIPLDFPEKTLALSAYRLETERGVEGRRGNPGEGRGQRQMNTDMKNMENTLQFRDRRMPAFFPSGRVKAGGSDGVRRELKLRAHAVETPCVRSLNSVRTQFSLRAHGDLAPCQPRSEVLLTGVEADFFPLLRESSINPTMDGCRLLPGVREGGLRWL